ncbi:CDP-diacylglycerol--serine O-phosphatidyltransferase [Stappia taiwanensis]|uniref:CDP-diacylglycerol--serine O-phosphatidyltransferase n=1 Tax=Stappia taiwanensis TaxID=992267 RepID=A0A838XY30_9HYPH|nr:CDP-diacylglycerol--serine O-phosphatidyltransferase [Stappia taiwanensis]MBA4611690.1 CDP-diacylglycerol--serine O-phosphatidyltransferase [Stappia taiwanensis]GGE97536.1 CDP-diacylglycerol--serine O-phosphatidyltransferase [Stappia taiwanensis]
MSAPFAPYDPGPTRRRRGRAPRFRRVPLRLVLPNLVTLLALCSGLTAIRMALEARWDYAIGAIVLAAVLDALDGRVARFLKGTSRFGAELDSLADFVNFGVAPALILYSWLLNEVRSIGWIAALVFSISAALRLARFNVSIDDPDKPAWAVNFFTGVPAPAGALSVLLPVYLEFVGLLPHWPALAPVVAVYVVLIALLMVSRLPTFSGKKLGSRIRRDLVLPLFVAAVLVVALLVSYPFQMLAVGATGYLISIPFALHWHAKYRDGRIGGASAAEAGEDESEDDTDLDHLGDNDKDDTG